MTHEHYKYDVAFSFLAQDEGLALQLNDLLQDRLRTFIYSERQKELAGTDGEKAFNVVFGKESRLVVVLYRKGWGETPWTRIEETAIRDRAYYHGYNFVVFVQLDEPPSTPEWLPRTQLYIGLKRWGPEGAASAIETRVQELGGEPHVETVAERAARLDRARNFEAHRTEFLRSMEGVKSATTEFKSLKAEIEKHIDQVNGAASSFELKARFGRYQIVIYGLGLFLNVEYFIRFTNSLEDSCLSIEIWDGHPPFPGIGHFQKPRIRSKITFNFDLLESGSKGWSSTTLNHRCLATNDLSSFILNYYFENGAPKRKS